MKEELGPCAYCGESGVRRLTLIPARYANRKGSRVIVKQATTIDVCAVHARQLIDNNPDLDEGG